MKTKSLLSVIVLLLVVMSFASTASAQSPEMMSYQCVIRNTAGALVANQSVGIKISVLQGTATGTVVYSEGFAITTNENGLLSLEIGTGLTIFGTFTGIDWTSGPYFLKTEIDPTGGATYTISSVSQFLSVPYSMYAVKAGTFVSGASGDLSGMYPSPTVVKIQTLPVSTLAPVINDALVWNGIEWAPVQNVTGAAGGDLSGTYPNPSVVQIQSKPVSAVVPASNDALVWNGTSWTPTPSSGLGTNYWSLNGTSDIFNNNSGGLVGIGTNAPTYKLDVLHGGGSGARIRSSSSFSTFDIDAQSGDAALRFANNSVNQWNMRNRPSDNYLEIFEMGGGGSRMVIQDATGNVGIGETTNPIYRLDVLHGGGSGARIKSSSSFSTVDIDAQSGDASLRFLNAGVSQWNMRNRPADNYLEIFEMGGGGSRMVIQDATGNVGIGETTSPAYRLDVLHGGATGARVRSSSSFSVVDIDGQNGDAALRFVKAGVNQWNIRNNPATDDLQFFELGGGGERMRIDNTTGKVWVNGDFTVIGVKAFTMDHPLDPANKTLMHAAVESNEVINFYSGNVTTDVSGKAVVRLPDYFEAINKDFRYQLTVIGVFAQAIVSREVSNNTFEISTSQSNVKVSWEVKGVRNDMHMRKYPFTAEQEKPALQKGQYLDPAAYNLPENKRVSYDGNTSGISSLDYIAPVQQTAAPAKTGGSLDPMVAPKSKMTPDDHSGSVSEGSSKDK